MLLFDLGASCEAILREDFSDGLEIFESEKRRDLVVKMESLVGSSEVLRGGEEEEIGEVLLGLKEKS